MIEHLYLLDMRLDEAESDFGYKQAKIDTLLSDERGAVKRALMDGICVPLLNLVPEPLLVRLMASFTGLAQTLAYLTPSLLVFFGMNKDALGGNGIPVVTTLGMVFSFLLGANVLVEKVFAWPGIGSFAVEALIASDFAPLQGFVLTMAVMYVALNLIIDILYGLIDPRVRLEA